MSIEKPVSSGGQEPERNESLIGIERAANFDELLEALRTIGGLTGSDKQFYSAADLVERIQQVQAGTEIITSITRTGGLREKVAALLENVENTGELVLPAVGDPITLTKISQAKGQQQMQSRAVLEGVLMQEIKVGEPLSIGAGRHTSVVQSIKKRGTGLIVETESSTYLLEKKEI